MKNWSVTLTVPISRDAADVVAAEIEQHQVLGALLRIGEQLVLERLVLVRGRAARARAGDRPDGHRAVAHAHQDFRARADDREIAEVEEEQERRGIDAAQRAVEREGRQRERRLEALRQHDLENVAGRDVVLGARSTMALNSAGVVLEVGKTLSGPASPPAAALSSGVSRRRRRASRRSTRARAPPWRRRRPPAAPA